MNTNAAYHLAKQWLAAFSVDVKALERDSTVEIHPYIPAGPDKFIPIYWVRWMQPRTLINSIIKGAPDQDAIATVRLLEPEHLLLQLQVDRQEYLKRKRLIVRDRDRLLQQTDDPKMREMWFTTDAYEKAALKAMLKEVNRFCRDLHLSQKLPIRASDLADVTIETPFFSDHQGSFACIRTEDFTFGADVGNKLSFFGRSQLYGEDSKFLTAIKNRYALAKSRLNILPCYLGEPFRAQYESNYLALKQASVEMQIAGI